MHCWLMNPNSLIYFRSSQSSYMINKVHTTNTLNAQIGRISEEKALTRKLFTS